MKTILESKTNRCVFQPIKLSKAILQRSSVAWFGTRVFLGGRAGGGRVRRRKGRRRRRRRKRGMQMKRRLKTTVQLG
jgi:hypothetical protein|tara:strand:- start:1115 stop:1345 length:231 start_codon:yes stop_codon:yes gene_type:complete